MNKTLVLEVWEDGSFTLDDHLSKVTYVGKGCKTQTRLDMHKVSLYAVEGRMQITNLNLDVEGDTVVSRRIT